MQKIEPKLLSREYLEIITEKTPDTDGMWNFATVRELLGHIAALEQASRERDEKLIRAAWKNGEEYLEWHNREYGYSGCLSMDSGDVAAIIASVDEEGKEVGDVPK